MTPIEALTRIEAQPLTLSNGQTLLDWLARETSLGPKRAPNAIREYQRFLALALSAAPGEITVPSAMAEQVWLRHQEDATAWEGFHRALGSPHLLRHARREDAPLHAAMSANHQRYETAFGPAPRPSWLARQIPGLIRKALAVALMGLTYLVLKDSGTSQPGLLLPLIFLPGWVILKAEDGLSPRPFRA